MAWYDIMYDIKRKRNLSFAREATRGKPPAAALRAGLRRA